MSNAPKVCMDLKQSLINRGLNVLKFEYRESENMCVILFTDDYTLNKIKERFPEEFDKLMRGEIYKRDVYDLLDVMDYISSIYVYPDTGRVEFNINRIVKTQEIAPLFLDIQFVGEDKETHEINISIREFKDKEVEKYEEPIRSIIKAIGPQNLKLEVSAVTKSTKEKPFMTVEDLEILLDSLYKKY